MTDASNGGAIQSIAVDGFGQHLGRLDASGLSFLIQKALSENAVLPHLAIAKILPFLPKIAKNTGRFRASQ